MSEIVIKSAVPTWSKPETISNVGHGRARPIQHYRKQLMPSSSSGRGSNSAVGMPMDIPGGSSVTSVSDACLALSEKVNNVDHCINKACIDGSDVRRNSEKKYYPATTKLSKNYYTDSRAYLRSRCKTFDQNSKIKNVANDQFQSTSCYDVVKNDGTTIHTCGSKTVAYKPKGAVSSSSRLLRLKENTLKNNDPNISRRYPSDTYLFRNKKTPCMNHRKNGKMTMCF